MRRAAPWRAHHLRCSFQPARGDLPPPKAASAQPEAQTATPDAAEAVPAVAAAAVPSPVLPPAAPLSVAEEEELDDDEFDEDEISEEFQKYVGIGDVHDVDSYYTVGNVWPCLHVSAVPSPFLGAPVTSTPFPS